MLCTLTMQAAPSEIIADEETQCFSAGLPLGLTRLRENEGSTLLSTDAQDEGGFPKYTIQILQRMRRPV